MKTMKGNRWNKKKRYIFNVDAEESGFSQGWRWIQVSNSTDLWKDVCLIKFALGEIFPS